MGHRMAPARDDGIDLDDTDVYRLGSSRRTRINMAFRPAFKVRQRCCRDSLKLNELSGSETQQGLSLQEAGKEVIGPIQTQGARGRLSSRSQLHGLNLRSRLQEFNPMSYAI
ncbi:hypothetical protein HYALB_00001094 [Hymenoscyphus albidus]|uniref:Uncharacterized protein n=1 Tax=Hymenoscyphus albidus TaxID=595503 RepID=A0A9N9Q1V0_9HELO|nr:hypothetical protein HYALB_00001094 [Hymenoscyphus albidus]